MKKIIYIVSILFVAIVITTIAYALWLNSRQKVHFLFCIVFDLL